MPAHGGNRTYDPWNTSLMLCQLSYAVRSVRVCDVAQLAEHWARATSQKSYSPEYITPTQKNSRSEVFAKNGPQNWNLHAQNSLH